MGCQDSRANSAKDRAEDGSLNSGLKLEWAEHGWAESEWAEDGWAETDRAEQGWAEAEMG